MVDPEDRDKRVAIRWSWCVADSNDVSSPMRIGGKYFHSEGVERATFLQCLEICPRNHGAAQVARSSGCVRRRKISINNSLGRSLNGIRDEWEQDSESVV